VVKYWLTKAMLNCEHRFKRQKKFKPDPSIPEYTNLDSDYKHLGYDRGHQMVVLIGQNKQSLQHEIYG